MLKQISGLHHVTSLAANPVINNAFFTNTLGLRRVKKTVNFDRPDVYHLYYGDEKGSPGTVMTYFPFPGMKPGSKGAGEASTTAFSVPIGSLGFWKNRLNQHSVAITGQSEAFGENRLSFSGPDGDEFALVEVDGDNRTPWTDAGIAEEVAIRGFHSTSMRIKDAGAMKELMTFMNYEEVDSSAGHIRMAVSNGNGAHIIDLEEDKSFDNAQQGAGSVHHVAFAVDDRKAQLEVRKALMDTGYSVTPVKDRNYFYAIYFRTPDGILFEVATHEPGFDHDEDTNLLGAALKLPEQHEHLRSDLEEHLQPL